MSTPLIINRLCHKYAHRGDSHAEYMAMYINKNIFVITSGIICMGMCALN